MKTVRKLLAVLLIVFLLSTLFALPVFAQGTEPAPDPALPPILEQLGALAGWAALVAVLINIGKLAGLVKDGQAGKYNLFLNLGGLVALTILKVFAPDVDILVLDSFAAQIAQVLVSILALVGMLGFSKISHLAVKHLPVIGKSYSS